MFRLLVCGCLLAAVPARAERLPTAVYSTADGLANDHVDRGTRDPRGFLWLATLDGVSRFDGRDFVNYGIADGLPVAATNDIVAARDGTIWVATDRGVAWLDPMERASPPRFHIVAPDHANCLFEDPAGALWVGLAQGLARVDRARHALVPVPLRPGNQPVVLAIAHDPRDSSLWIGTDWGLVHRAASGAIDQYRVMPAHDTDDRVFGVAVDRRGLVWLGTVGTQILGIASRPGERIAPPGVSVCELAHTRPDWLHYTARNWARRGVLEDREGNIWIGTSGEVVRYDGERFEDLVAARTGVSGGLAPITEDEAGNLWLASETRGVVRLAPRGMVSYDQRDGLRGSVVHDFIVGPHGALYVMTYDHGHALARRDGDHFTSVVPGVRGHADLGWGWNQAALIDRDGRWWLTTGEGVARYPAGTRFEDLGTTRPDFFDMDSGLPGHDAFRIYEDRRGDIWVTTVRPTGVARWDRAAGAFQAVGPGWPHGIAYAYAEDPGGALWVGFEHGRVARLRDGTLTVLGPEAGLPDASVVAILADARGRVWLATDSAGVLRIDDPEAPLPRIRRYGRAEGLASDQVQSLIDDTAGRIYLATINGVDRIDPTAGAIDHFGTAEGLPSLSVSTAARTPDGALWFGTQLGVARYVPTREPLARAPATSLEKLAIAGRPRAVAFAGDSLSSPLGPDDDQLDLTFTAPSFAGPVRFQYRVNAGPWSAPSPERALHFPRLPAGSYRLEVRAALGGVVGQATHLSLEILPPIYRRTWFLALAALLVIAAGYVLYRWRLAHLLAVERVRSRIASDLHDEIGSSLSRISILSELASRRAAAHEDVQPQIHVIGTSARELLDAASDIVWSTDPRRDDLDSLIVRLRAFAADVLESRGIAWALDAPRDPDRIKLDPDRRRHVYLVLKEAIHNAARHSNARRVDIAIRATASGLVASVRDDGSGIDEDKGSRTGNGLANMRARAAEIGGSLDIRHDAGTEIVLRV